MPEERRQDPANTQMFRAFVERNPQEPEKKNRTSLIAVVIAVLVAAGVLLVVLLTN